MKLNFYILLLLILGTTVAHAEIGPEFRLDLATWDASDIVVATEGDKIDGILQVQETWKGGLNVGQDIEIPEIAKVNRPISVLRRLKINDKLSTIGPDPNHPSSASATRLVLFLISAKSLVDKGVQVSGNTKIWIGASLFNDIPTSIVWIEKGNGYAALRAYGGNSFSGLTEGAFKAQVESILKLQASLKDVVAIQNLEKRAQSLEVFSGSTFYLLRQESLKRLAQCGDAGLPVIRHILSDKVNTQYHDEVIRALGEMKSRASGIELISIVEQQLKYWGELAPKLDASWWNWSSKPYGVPYTVRDQYWVLHAALWELKEHRYRVNKETIEKTRNLWAAFPSLMPPSGSSSIIDFCDAILRAANQKRPNNDDTQTK